MPESCSIGLVVCPSPAAPGGPSPAEEGGKPESSAFTGLCAMFYDLSEINDKRNCVLIAFSSICILMHGAFDLY